MNILTFFAGLEICIKHAKVLIYFKSLRVITERYCDTCKPIKKLRDHYKSSTYAWSLVFTYTTQTLVFQICIFPSLPKKCNVRFQTSDHL